LTLDDRIEFDTLELSYTPVHQVYESSFAYFTLSRMRLCRRFSIPDGTLIGNHDHCASETVDSLAI